jgi:hypothetical protein
MFHMPLSVSVFLVLLKTEYIWVLYMEWKWVNSVKLCCREYSLGYYLCNEVVKSHLTLGSEEGRSVGARCVYSETFLQC